MKRHLLFLLLTFSAFSSFAQEKVRFIAFTDLHTDIIPDGLNRLKEIVSSSENNDVDFIIQLGDFAINHTRNDSVMKYWNNLNIPNYSVLGNHDLDLGSKKEYCRKVGIENSYYTFDHGIFRFIILDTNFCTDPSDEIVDYNHSNYYSSKNKDLINSDQLDWIDLMINDKTKHYILFSHTPIDGVLTDNASHKKARALLESKKREGFVIALALSGHNHLETYNSIQKINYCQLNSASYISVGKPYTNKANYPDSIYKKHPYLAHTLPYKGPLYT
ncbi:MAG: metallophosphoesterase family protein, partial [Bacteroidales bacterium]